MIGRLLSRLTPLAAVSDLVIVVVAHGCTDNTAEIASSFGPGVRVLSLGTASRQAALRAGDDVATGFPRLYVDADVDLGQGDVRVLLDEVRRPGVLAAAPERVLPLQGCPWQVRWYYDVWLRLPEVRRGLFGRGVLAVSEAGHARLARLPPTLFADDLAASLSFAPAERSIVTAARAIRQPPRTFAGLVRRRMRAAARLARLERVLRHPSSVARTRPGDLAAIVRADPRAAPRVAYFLSVAALATLAARLTRRPLLPGFRPCARIAKNRLAISLPACSPHYQAATEESVRTKLPPTRNQAGESVIAGLAGNLAGKVTGRERGSGAGRLDAVRTRGCGSALWPAATGRRGCRGSGPPAFRRRRRPAGRAEPSAAR